MRVYPLEASREEPCPLCGGVLERTPAERETTIAPGYFIVGRSVLERRLASCVVLACTECEHVEEVHDA